ncbi:MAG: radical SAM protein [Planctomycetota bacterium]|jgi:uncharacterized Fe-S cluster-containing radical SAM superfamily protein
MYDPVEKAQEVAALVCRGERRKYHRFRPAGFYGGIATADCLGCNLRCLFCWSWDKVVRPEKHGYFHGPAHVADRLVAIADRHRFARVRISGAEPTLGRAHLLGVIRRVPERLRFILETNGILLGHDASYAEDLAGFPHLLVRVSLKGATEAEFSLLTGARPEGFALQRKALFNLHRAGARVQPAVMVGFSLDEDLAALRRDLETIAPELADFEEEELILYRGVKERLRRAGVAYRRAYAPE